MSEQATAAVLTPAQELYRLEKARKGVRVDPVIEAARAELQRRDDERKEARKGGRPRGSGMTLGKAGRPRNRVYEPEPAMPGRPEWLTPPSPVRDDVHPDSRTTMARKSPTYPPRTCGFCEKNFVPRGGRQITCSEECKTLLADRNQSSTKAAGKRKTVDKKRKPVDTGYRSPRSTRAASGFSAAIAELQGELATIDARRERIVGAIENLRELSEAS